MGELEDDRDAAKHAYYELLDAMDMIKHRYRPYLEFQDFGGWIKVDNHYFLMKEFDEKANT